MKLLMMYILCIFFSGVVVIFRSIKLSRSPRLIVPVGLDIIEKQTRSDADASITKWIRVQEPGKLVSKQSFGPSLRV
jgi:hypothetical protein